VDDTLQGSTLTTQFLGSIRIIPNAGFGQLQLYLGQAFLAIIEVKDTP